MAIWNPWRGCRKCSDGCLHCYIHKGDLKRNVNTNEIVKTKDFNKPIEKLKKEEIENKELTIYYDMQCPYVYQTIETIFFNSN